jgi:ribosomal protein L19
MYLKKQKKKRIQTYQGTVIRHRAGLNSTITVRRIAKGIGERIFPCIVLILSRLKKLVVSFK